MTAALARQKTGPAGASRGQEDSRSETLDATNSIAVLISLPDLNEPASKEKASATAIGSRAQNDIAASDPEPAVEPPVAEEPSDQADDASASLANEESDAGSSVEEPTDTEVSTWSAFTVPRPVMQLAGVLALVGVLIGAYFVIVGGKGGTVDEDTGKVAGEQTSDAWAEPSPPIESAGPTDIAATPALEGDQPQQLFAESRVDRTRTDATEPADDQEAKETLPLTMETETTVVLDPLEKKTDPADSSPQSESWADDDRLGDFGVDAEPGPEAHENMGHCTQPQNQSNGIIQGPETPQLGQTVDTPPQQYPDTDPSTYQYPEHYHEMFQPSPDMGSLPGPSPRPTERSIYQQYPDTARLRPPIDPPPVRR